MKANDIIELLGLEPLPHEGGYFQQTYRLQADAPAERLAATAIYYLLTSDDFSAIHRLDSDEIYHFYLGDPFELLLLYPDGTGEVFVLGNDLSAGMRPQKIVPAGVWQGSRLIEGGSYGFGLVGTTMTPGFSEPGFELGDRAELIGSYPDFKGMIEARTNE